jgi:hypothetical protein
LQAEALAFLQDQGRVEVRQQQLRWLQGAQLITGLLAHLLHLQL